MKYKMDITELLRDPKWHKRVISEHKAKHKRISYGASAQKPYTKRSEYKNEPDKIAIKDLLRLFTEYVLPQRNIYHNRGQFVWTNRTDGNTGWFLAQADKDREKMQLWKHNNRRMSYFKIHDHNSRIKLQDKILKKKSEKKKAIEMMKQNPYEEKNSWITI